MSKFHNVKNRNSSCLYCGSTENLTIEHVLPKSLFKHYDQKSRLMALACYSCNNQVGTFNSAYDDMHRLMLKPSNPENHIRACLRLMLKIKKYYKDSFYADILLDEIFELILLFHGHSPLTFENRGI